MSDYIEQPAVRMGHSSFDDIEDKNLQAYNRLVYANNLVEDAGSEEADNYISMFSKDDQAEIVSIIFIQQQMQRA
jgi:hypothetical protein